LRNGKLPIREKGYNWKGTVPGNTTKTLWTSYHTIEELPHYLNPSSGYLFNSNHSPFNASAMINNLYSANYDETMGYETNENNRSVRFMELMRAHDKIDYETFRRIKFDRQLPKPLEYGTNADTLFMLSEAEYPSIADIITTLKQWDRNADAGNTGATIFGIAFYYVVDKLRSDHTYRDISVEKAVEI